MEQIGQERGDATGAGRRSQEEGDDGQRQRGEEGTGRSAELVLKALLLFVLFVL